MIKKTILAIASTLLLLAQPAYSASRGLLYADLVRDDAGRYTITHISNKKLKFDLATLEPVGFDTKKWDCSTALWGLYRISPNDCIPPDTEFRTERSRLWPTLKLGITSVGISLLLGIVKEEGVFDYGAYNRAVSEALAHTNIDSKRKDLVRRYAQLVEAAELHNVEISTIYRKMSEPYITLKPLTVLKKTLVDASGIYRDGDLHPDLFIKSRLRNLSEIMPGKYSPPEFSATPETLEEELAFAEATMEKELAERKEAFLAAMAEATSSIDIVCEPEYMQPYHLKYECPQSIPVESEQVFEAKALVVSKDLKDLFPTSFPFSDENLKVEFTKNWIVLENTSPKRLKIKAVTIHYNDQSYTFNPDKNFIADTLEPGQSTKTLIQIKMLTGPLEKTAEFKEMNAEKIKSIRVAFRMDIEYSLVDSRGELFVQVQKMLSSSRAFKYEDLY